MSQFFWVSVLVLPFNIIGNSLVLIVYKKRKISKKSFLLLVNLAVADLLFGVGQLILTILSQTLKPNDEKRASLFCKLEVLLTYQTSCVSVFILTIMSVERYGVIVKPIKVMTIWTSTVSRVVVTAAWILSITLTVPIVPFVTQSGTSSRTCTLGQEYFYKVQLYHIALGIVIIIVPYVVICAMYFQTIQFLWSVKRKDDERGTSRTLMKSRQRLTILMVLITLLFTICWLHLPIRRAMDLFQQNSQYVVVHPVSIQILCVHSTVNPILYSITSSSFRESVKNLFECRRKNQVKPFTAFVKKPHVMKMQELIK
ncbi:somatostatin receptor type 1 [Exaiptasia diaphana]|uniref:G-protein coupled receptors family 1 profile domain-containing protein n=1 Tax=Exaiptasia diaphana TaxID=2652724 RepID=A0A913XBQ3_EXADI|nr:somatostatin receptor type 1 [Exaiptasia diaphana]KXJ26445.1 Apelin receptor [Exaiptasia diaphana]